MTIPLTATEVAYLRDQVRIGTFPASAARKALGFPSEAWAVGRGLAKFVALFPVIGLVPAIVLSIWTLAVTLALLIVSPVLAILMLPFVLSDRHQTLRDIARGTALQVQGSFVVATFHGSTVMWADGSRRFRRHGAMTLSSLSRNQLNWLTQRLTKINGWHVFDGSIVRTAARPVLLAVDDQRGNTLLSVPDHVVREKVGTAPAGRA